MDRQTALTPLLAGESGLNTLTRDNSTNAVLNVLSSEPFVFSITHVCQLSGLSRPTVTRILGDLIDHGLVATKTATRAHATGGRKPQLFSLNRSHHCSVVLRVNYDVVQAFALDAAGDVITRLASDFSNPSEVGDRLVGALGEILDSIERPIYSVAVVVMGIVNRGLVVRSESFPALNDNAWVGRLDQILAERGHEARVVALNDAKVAAQWMYSQLNAPDSAESMIAIHCSEDIGCGLIFGGVLLEGAHGAAGEILQDTDGAWMQVSKFLRELEGQHGDPIRTVFAHAQQIDRDKPFIGELGKLMGRALTPMVLTLDPDTVAVGGAIVDCGPALMEAIDRELRSATPTPPAVRVAPQGAQSVQEGAKMYVLGRARRQMLDLVNPPAQF
ncbi:ROK family transcriptional regulator [Trueperella pecoris]|uniref:ROK family transcriptional regulator n=1 Tax=Trueperella pecoris TaxID=2733571 RepID=A0A7M1QUF4_9ACTO|nr:ROK family transcriptional regulator [Trueperella pecoris]QOQ38066.1 ROK family transcriptional regulator [Trueperella pecoris]QOR45486.1 ROK family transcriptional regulator [Trueperella pecoris]QTG75326.1 ROK family transcriptional regulator [Trueperella pecoris]